MGKYKFVLTKHTKQNGDYYYTCKTLVEVFRKPRNIFELFKYGIEGVRSFDEYSIRSTGYAYFGQEYRFDEREQALLAIDEYIKIKDKEDGEKVISTETEVIYL